MRLFTSSMIVGIGIGLVACSTEENQQTSNQENMKYPTTRKDSTVVDEYFGII